MDVEENVKLYMERNIEALSKLILVKSKEGYLAQYKLSEKLEKYRPTFK